MHRLIDRDPFQLALIAGGQCTICPVQLCEKVIVLPHLSVFQAQGNVTQLWGRDILRRDAGFLFQLA